MRVLIAGAGKVGRSIAGELLEARHEVVLIDKDPNAEHVPGAVWHTADACEIASLDAAGLDDCQVVIAATGDDKANLVVSLLAKTEYGVPRVVGRVNHPKNEWLFTESWGVDVAVSSPRLLSALVEEAVTVGDLVRLLSLRQGRANLVEWTLERNAVLVGARVGDLRWPPEAMLVAILREGQVIPPTPDDSLEAGDELLFVSTAEAEAQLTALLSDRAGSGRPAGSSDAGSSAAESAGVESAGVASPGSGASRGGPSDGGPSDGSPSDGGPSDGGPSNRGE